MTFGLPMLNAILNFTALMFLLAGYRFIRQGRWQAHRAMMLTAFACSILFLISYLTNQAINGRKDFDGEGLIRFIYLYIVLLPHVVLAATVPFLAAVTIWRGLKTPYQNHAKIARITFPIWVYVSVTGIIVYFMAHTTLLDPLK
ncbi:MAG: DUF420 domain-containing protein [Phototrophicales bacterium]|nr:MAG: DUF420 domain-containing protein [Phototrophicales bacterium]